MNKKIRLLVNLLLVTMLLLSSCGSNNENTKNDVGSEDSKKDTLNFAFIAETKELDPHKSSDTLTYIILSQIFDTLIKIEPMEH